jgi:hypothetical protein
LWNDQNIGIFVAVWYNKSNWMAYILAIMKVVITVFCNYIFVLKPSLITFFSASESMQVLLVLGWLETNLEVINKVLVVAFLLLSKFS